MAKAKKKEALSLEEILEQALVPVDEQPYEVPENWCWTYLRYIAQWGSGGTPSRKNPAYYEGNIPWVKTGELEDGYLYDTEEKISDEAIQKSSAKLFPVESVLIAMYGATIGKTAILGVEATTNQACACAICNESVYNKYLFYYLRSQKDSFIEQGKGGAQPNISQDIIKRNIIPLPPKAEQQRIVEQIEGLFAKLDEAKEMVQAVVDGYEDRISAIYNKAFKGDYTINWRTQKGITMEETWKKVISQDVCEPIMCGKTPKEYISESGEIPYLKVYNIVDNQIDFIKTPQYIPRDIHEGKLKSSRLRSGDVVMNIVGPPLRKVAIIPDDYPEWNMNQAIVRFRPQKEAMIPKFLYYALLNPETLEEVISQTRGVVGQANISVSQSRNLELPCPSIEEQYEIVKILDSLFDKERVVLEKVNNIIEMIDTMKKSVLANAFRGELGTNISSEESSVNLLKNILS